MRRWTSWFLAATLSCWPLSGHASESTSKVTQTPCFCQKDTAFENNGANFCAPTAVADGLAYLARAKHLDGLVPGSQIELIKALAERMETDPDKGTSPRHLVEGLEGYLAQRGYPPPQIQVATWRTIPPRYKAADKPDLAWIRATVADPDTVVLFNAGWYRAEQGGYKRHNGHWVTVVGEAGGGFLVHNPGLKAEQQATRSQIKLTPLEPGFKRVDSKGRRHELAGYYGIGGPGLPVGAKKRAVLDSVLAFKVSPRTVLKGRSMSKLELRPAVRPGWKHGLASATQRNYLDFVIDGTSLVTLLEADDFISVLGGFPGPPWREQLVNELLLRVPNKLPEERRQLYICPECGDMGCGVYTAVIRREGHTVVWSDFARLAVYDVDPLTMSQHRKTFPAVGPFFFDAERYEETLRTGLKAASLLPSGESTQ